MEENKNNDAEVVNEEEKTELEKKLDEVESKMKERGLDKQEEKELTEEQKKIIEEREKEQAEKEKAELEKKKGAFKILQQGGYFMKYIWEDIERQKRQQLNRAQRRRFEERLKKGYFTKEMVDVYCGKMDVALEWIEKNLMGAEGTKNKITTHYKTQGFDNPEFLKSILEDYFGTKFAMPGEETEPVDAVEMYENAKKEENEQE